MISNNMVTGIISKRKLWQWGKALSIVLALFLIFQLLTPVFSSGQSRDWVADLGIFGPLIIVCYIAISHILAPLAGTPGVVVSAALFGIYQTVFYLYIAGLISSVINFWISRKLGRKWMVRVAGRKTAVKIDEFVEVFGDKLLIISRLFGFAFFEVISYAAGLTIISFKKYFLITLIFSAVPAFIFAFLFRSVDFLSWQTILIWLATITITGAIFAFFIKRFIRKTRNSANKL